MARIANPGQAGVRSAFASAMKALQPAALRRPWLVSLLLLAGWPAAALAEPAVQTSAQLRPLDDEQARVLAAIPDEHTGLPERHYFRSNEWYQGVLRAPL